jgi:alpha-ketoglutarate-dependent taurine dioxygenase
LGILEVSKHIKKEHQKELYYLWFNFLSDPETTIRYEYQEKKSLLGDNFEIEYLGKLFK